MEKIFVDTSAWYAFLNINDDSHESIKTLLIETQSSLVTSNFIITEVLNLLVARRKKHMALEFGKSLREKSDIFIFQVSQADENEAWKIFQKYKDKDYSFTDCTSFALLQRLKIEKVLALDDDFREMGFTLIQ